MRVVYYFIARNFTANYRFVRFHLVNDTKINFRNTAANDGLDDGPVQVRTLK